MSEIDKIKKELADIRFLIREFPSSIAYRARAEQLAIELGARIALTPDRQNVSYIR